MSVSYILSGIDQEVQDLCRVMGSLPGIEVVDSSCGLLNFPVRIWFLAPDIRARGMILLARLTCIRYSPDAWTIQIMHGDVEDRQVTFMLESKAVGLETYEAVVNLSKEIRAHISRTTGTYNILFNSIDPD